jgi:hypothetical protein
MDLKAYFKTLRQVESNLPADEVVVASLATADGGRAGELTEASRTVAAKLIVDGAARLGTGEEARQYHERAAELRRQAEQKEAASRIRVVWVSETGDEDKKQKPRGTTPRG